MSLTYRAIAIALTHGHRRGGVATSLQSSSTGHDLGFAGRINCLPWEGMYVDQAPLGASDDAEGFSNEELDQFLADILSH